MIILLILFFIPNSKTFCEIDWKYAINTTYNITNNIEYNITAGEHLVEPGNAISSLVYTGFGIVGLLLKNHSTMYYLVMNLFMLVGITSFLHHYYISFNTWTHAADVINMELLASFSLLYIVCDNEYNHIKYLSCIKKVSNLVITICCLSLLTLFKINYGERTLLLQIVIGGIVVSQAVICLYFFYIQSILKYRILFSSVWSGIIFAIGVSMWYIDNTCPRWTWNTFNGHAIWHVCLAWSLFNVINVTNVCRYDYNYIKYTWRPLCNKFPSILYLIILTNEKSNIRNNYTNIAYEDMTGIALEEIKLIQHTKTHRRTKTVG